MNIDIQMPVFHMDSSLVTDLCCASLKHILFIREQLPVPFETIAKSEELSTYRPSKRKIETFLERVTTIEEDLRTIFSLIDAAEIQLIFGPSLTSPKEIYCLHIPRPQQGYQIGTEAITEKKHRECLRRTIRSFIQYWGEIECKPMTPSNTFIAIRPHDSTTIQTYADALEATSCFGPRVLAQVGLVTKLRKKSQPPLHFWFMCKEEEIIIGKKDEIIKTPPTMTATTSTTATTSNEEDVQNLPSSHSQSYLQCGQENITCSRSSNSLEHDEQVMPDLGGGSSSTWLVLKKGIKGLKNIRLNT